MKTNAAGHVKSSRLRTLKELVEAVKKDVANLKSLRPRVNLRGIGGTHKHKSQKYLCERKQKRGYKASFYLRPIYIIFRLDSFSRSVRTYRDSVPGIDKGCNSQVGCPWSCT